MCEPGERIEANVPLMEIVDSKKEDEWWLLAISMIALPKQHLLADFPQTDILSRAERRHILSERHTNDSTIVGTAMIISWKKPGTGWGVLVQKMRITLPRLRFRAAYSSNTSLIGIHEELRKSSRMRIFGGEVWSWNRPHDIHDREADNRKIWFRETV